MMPAIRRAVPLEADLLSHIAVSAKQFWDYPDHWIAIWIPQLTFSPAYIEENECWVAEQNNTVIAFYTMQDRDGKAWIENMWVTPSYIGRGVGKQLFTHSMGLARQRKYKLMQLEAEPNAAGFYEKMGMRNIGETKYELDGEPRFLPLMEITL